MNPNCARCGKIVYPTEKVNCLDKFWNKACFHCETCKMTLNMKNYKGYEKKPYCNAHYPKQSFTTVADTPENLRLKQQSELQSQIRYKEEFEKNKGKGFSVVADTPELQRIKKTQDQISNIKYHEEFEKSRMGMGGGEPGEVERRNSQDSTSYRRPTEQQPPQHQQPHHIQPSTPVYQQQQQPPPQPYGYKEPVAPVSIQRNAPSGGGVSMGWEEGVMISHPCWKSGQCVRIGFASVLMNEQENLAHSMKLQRWISLSGWCHDRWHCCCRTTGSSPSFL
uniref:LIM and SH3 domain protein 1 n=1 Tax=Sphenodon punctatus TaxID=8508 RepID=A0A8D0LBV8_SPHPU